MCRLRRVVRLERRCRAPPQGGQSGLVECAESGLPGRLAQAVVRRVELLKQDGLIIERRQSSCHLGGGETKHGNSVPLAKAHARSGSSGAGIWALIRLVVLVAAALAGLVVLTKIAVRKGRYLTRDPRRVAQACVRELSDFAADQGAKAPPSATLRELAQLIEDELGVSASAFAAAAAEARFGPLAPARTAARRARSELRSLRRELRTALSSTDRAIGLVSLRSFGLTG